MKTGPLRITRILPLVLVALGLLPGLALAYVCDFDLRWDGSNLVGGYLLNPSELVLCDEATFTIDAQSEGERRIWGAHYAKPEATGLTGGIVVGGLENTYAYGIAGRLAKHLGAGISLQRTGWDSDDYEYSAGLGLTLDAGAFSLSAAGMTPVDGREADTEVEIVAALRNRVVGLTVGYLPDEDSDNYWAALRLSPWSWVSLAYQADLDEEGEVGDSTTSLKLGQNRYIVLAKKDGVATEEYSLGVGATF